MSELSHVTARGVLLLWSGLRTKEDVAIWSDHDEERAISIEGEWAPACGRPATEHGITVIGLVTRGNPTCPDCAVLCDLARESAPEGFVLRSELNAN